MAISIDTNAFARLAAFNTGDGNTIARKDGDGVKAGGTYSSANIFRWMRSGATKAANNEMRTELLKNLGAAFNLDGMTTDEKGKVRFSEKFMSQLEAILGKDFKRSDFGLDKSGLVASGKPLTERRIKAIVAKATIVGKGVFKAADYRVKLDAMKAQIAAMGDKAGSLAARAKLVGKCLDFLETKPLDSLVREADDFDRMDDASIHFMFSPKDKEGVAHEKPLRSKTALFNYISETYGLLMHPENVDATVEGRNLRDTKDVDFLKVLNAYVSNTLETFVKFSVDSFFDCVGTDLEKKMVNTMSGGMPCIEGKTTEITQFQAENGLLETEPVEGKGEAKADLDAADHTEQTPLLDCMAKEAAVLEARAAKNGDDKELGWDDYRPVFVKNLVGLKRPVPDHQTGEVTVREVTEADIEALRAELNNVLFFE